MKLLASLFILSLIVGCASKEAIRQAINDNPEIVFDAIKKNPEKFVEASMAANQVGRAIAAAKASELEKKAREEEFKNPTKPEISENRIQGNKNAPVAIVMYSDFQCPYCSRGHQTVESVMKKYPGKVNFVYKHLPLPFHEMAMPTSKYFEAIALQSPKMAYKFQEEIYKNQGRLSTDKEKFLDETTKKVGANLTKVKANLNSKKVLDVIEADKKEAASYGVQGTPGFVVGGVKVKGAQPIEVFEEIIERRLKEKSPQQAG